MPTPTRTKPSTKPTPSPAKPDGEDLPPEPSDNGNGKGQFLNSATLTLHVAAAPEMKFTAKGAAWTRVRAFVSMGKDKASGDYKPAMWLTVKAFTAKDGDGSLPQALNGYEKGAVITVTGRLSYEEWQTTEGETRGTIVLIASEIA